ncbi:MAG: beta-hydroxyacyl-ACP dehydratase [Pirellulaceae bacterium]|nr:MAG: beta-hydroxyacyl-ACP dehydratase [Pirellulaceae bacterium]
MAAREPILDLGQIDFDRVLADLDEIRRYNPQRFEMEQLTAIVYEDPERKICVGYKDVTPDEFWVRGHMPGLPLMPGVMMLEAAAQLCSYFTQKYDLLGAQMVGFGGLDEVRFRDPVVPGDRLVIVCQLVKLRRNRIIISRFEGWVGNRLVVEGQLKGVPIPIEALQSGARSSV